MYIIDNLKLIPAKELYRLFVDGCLHKKENGWAGYEAREAGCIAAGLNALREALANLDDPNISIELIKKIHAKVQPKNDDELVNQSGTALSNFRSHPTGYNLVVVDINSPRFKKLTCPYNATVQGINECLTNIQGSFITKKPRDIGNKTFLDNAETYKTDFFSYNLDEIAALKAYHRDYVYYYVAPSANKIESYLLNICDNYNKQLFSTITEEELIILIIRTLQSIARVHPFSDGNLRTVIMLLQRLLIQNGFMPVILWEPNSFELFSTDELKVLLKEGIENTKILIKEGKLFEYETPYFDKDEMKKITLYNHMMNGDFSVDTQMLCSGYEESEQSLYYFIQSIQPNFSSPRFKIIEKNDENTQSLTKLSLSGQDSIITKPSQCGIFSRKDNYSTIEKIPLLKEENKDSSCKCIVM